MKQIIVTGGRNYSDGNMVTDVLDVLSPDMIIQGGASGADRLAYEYATLYDVESVTVDADWQKHGNAAGPIRNKEMLVKYPEAIVVAFPGGKGTENCIKQAIALNRIVLQVK